MIQMNEPLIIHKDIYEKIADDLECAVFFIQDHNYVKKYNEDYYEFYIFNECLRQSSWYLRTNIIPILEQCSQHILNTNTWNMIIVGELLEYGISIYQIKNKKFKYRNINLQKIINTDEENNEENDEENNEENDEENNEVGIMNQITNQLITPIMNLMKQNDEPSNEQNDEPNDED